MTIFGKLSRALNRMSGGSQGQTLCARIGERWPECWFCRLMSRIVEPNHCAVELAHWQRTTYAAQPQHGHQLTQRGSRRKARTSDTNIVIGRTPLRGL